MPRSIIRIGLGLTVLGTVFVWLWPTNLSAEFNEGAHIIAFVSALAVWVAAEFWIDEQGANSPKEGRMVQEKSLSKNDMRNARQLLTYHKFCFRDLLKHQDLGGYFDYSYLSELHAFNHANETKQFEFLEGNLGSRWEEISDLFKEFGLFMAQNTTPDRIAGRDMVRLNYEAPLPKEGETEPQRSDADKGNELASNVWVEFDQFVENLKSGYPQVLDYPIKPEMYYV